VCAAALPAGIVQNSVDGFGQPDLPVGVPQQQRSRVTGDASAGEIEVNIFPFTGWKKGKFFGTLCHGGTLPVFVGTCFILTG
jgi:hypothetical protein